MPLAQELDRLKKSWPPKCRRRIFGRPCERLPLHRPAPAARTSALPGLTSRPECVLCLAATGQGPGSRAGLASSRWQAFARHGRRCGTRRHTVAHFKNLLARHGAVQSTSRRGVGPDNAHAELLGADSKPNHSTTVASAVWQKSVWKSAPTLPVTTPNGDTPPPAIRPQALRNPTPNHAPTLSGLAGPLTSIVAAIRAVSKPNFKVPSGATAKGRH